jgi:hypothetical protein
VRDERFVALLALVVLLLLDVREEFVVHSEGSYFR